MSPSGHSRLGRASSKSGHVRYAAESGCKFRALAAMPFALGQEARNLIVCRAGRTTRLDEDRRLVPLCNCNMSRTKFSQLNADRAWLHAFRHQHDPSVIGVGSRRRSARQDIDPLSHGGVNFERLSTPIALCRRRRPNARSARHDRSFHNNAFCEGTL
jgi:hypothetical protein